MRTLCAVLVFMAVCLVNGHCLDFKDQLGSLEDQFARLVGLTKYKKMDVKTVEGYLDKLTIKDELKSRAANLQERAICFTCQALIRKLQTHAITVELLGTTICSIYFTIQTWTINDFCKQIVRINKPILEYILANSKILTPEYACSILLQNENCYYDHPALKWETIIPDGGPILTTQNTAKLPPRSKPLKILHLSDFHISQDYEVGGVANCGYPVCCKRNLGNPIKGTDAGTWGEYNCDIPPWLYLDALQYINNTHKDLDLVYFTGDIIDHAIWKDSHQDNSNDIRFVFDHLAQSFPNIPILPTLGNHESVPLNMFPPPNITDQKLSQAWLYELIAELWSKWLPNEARSSVAKQGYYSVLANNKLRIISLNNNICYIYNWWLLYDTNFLKEQIEFLKRELVEAEANGQFVHIISHVYPGEKECIEPWEVNYNSLITRFAHIIKGQFFGHTHTDSFKVFYSKIDGRPNNVGYNGASLTPYLKYNPNYKIISVDPNTFNILDVDTYYFNLTEANLHPYTSPKWMKLYSIKEAYNFSDLSPDNFDIFAKRLSTDRNLLDVYWRFFVRNGDASLKDGCNDECRRNLLASITRTESLA
ncbi:sphingomyelin phosphodiesterase 1-like isoform X2 [Rhynchophorus ferrugineus]|uniref:sphingomyelin phosphodiesterase 1-like isoform X2 n=1 Tax=Rhynchophorus ferrugineus TaxID=354439 RepID=UPI003FCD79A6